MEGTDSGGHREGKRVVKTVQKASKDVRRGFRTANEKVIPCIGKTGNVIWVDVFLGPAMCNKSFKNRKGSRAVLNKLAAIQRSAVLTIVGGLLTSLNNTLDMHANLLPFHLMVNKVWYQVALRLAMLPSTHPLYKAINQAAQHFVKKHHSPLHELMFKFKLKQKLLEKIPAIRQSPKWELGVAIRIAEKKEKARDENNEDKACIKVFTDRSRIGGQIGAAAVLYHNGVLKRKKRMRLVSEKYHTVFKGKGLG